jgi:nicotinamidase/pyrazinamidase
MRYQLASEVKRMTEQSIIENDDIDALIIIDVQRDFCAGGALPVPEGDQVIPLLNRYIKLFDHARASIYATRDWHPPNHRSFIEQGGIWPSHCIQDSEGAEFHPDLVLVPEVKIISKATTPEKEAYSGFDGTDLAESLQQNSIRRIFIGGLATDYCVKNTVLDALKLGFETYVLTDAIRGVNAQPADSEKAIDEMVLNGARLITISNLKLSANLRENDIEDEILEHKRKKDIARARTRGPYRKAWRSQGDARTS